ncbi:TetR family transcriptional regulator C-terminal domain-containing protein [Nocardiopsis sp. NPDC055551]|uniref:TetR family transcriptional regulator C-terminal domain-containing protein n=1 Tax=Nocardiopsis sp. NPDC006832 TaxID=3157188 RepID=UPI0033EB2789
MRHERSIADVVCAALIEHLPLDEDRRAEHRVIRALAARALDNPRLAEVDVLAAEDTHARIARAIRNGFECGEVDPATDPDVAATRARAVVRAEIDTVFTGECGQYTRRPGT